MEQAGYPNTLGRFRVVEKLGEGGMGTVYVGVDDRLERRVALKVIRAEKRLDPIGKARFLREAKILSRLDHPGICKFYDLVEGEQEDCLVLELVDGVSLGDAMRDRTMTLNDRLEIARQILDVLVVVHGEGVIHRDLTPFNVMIRPTGDVKVLDFGLARVAEDPDWKGSPSVPPRIRSVAPDPGDAGPEQQTAALEGSTSGEDGGSSRAEAGMELATREGTVLGTAAYMSPEQARGEPLTAASDMFSYGLILQELFTGHPPYPRDLEPGELHRRAMYGETEPISGLRPDIASFLRRLTSLVPAARPSSVDAAQMLRTIIDRPRRRRRRAMVAAVWLVLAVFGAGMTLQFLRAERESRRAERQAARARAEATTARQVADFLVGLFEVSDPGRGDGADLTAHELLDAGATRLDRDLADQPAVHARMAHTMGVVYHHLGDLERSEEMLRTSLAERESALGRGSPDVADTLFELGLVLRYRNRFEESGECFARGLEIVESVFGHDAVESARFHQQIAYIAGYTGDFEAAEAGLEKALAIYETDPEANADGIGDALTGLAEFVLDFERYDEAERLLERSLEIHRNVHGEDSLDVAGVLETLGWVFIETDRREEAEQAMRRALEITESRLGADHPFTARAVNGLAHFYYSQGRYDDALVLMRRASRIYESAYGTRHRSTAAALSNLGVVLAETGSLDESESLLERSLDVMTSLVAPTDPDIAHDCYQLAKVKARLGKLDQAEALYRRALAIQEEAFGPDSRSAAATRARLEDLADSE